MRDMLIRVRLMRKRKDNLRLIYIRTKDSEFKVFLCGIQVDIFNTFLSVCITTPGKIKKWLRKWTREDFNWVIDFSEESHVKLLLELVVEKYKNVYPHIYKNHILTDDRLWLRIWVSEHMGKEIRKNDKSAYNRLFRPSSYISNRF